MSPLLYHVSSLAYAGGGEIILIPGPQGAEGKGVYFSEGLPRFSAAEGSRDVAPPFVFVIQTDSKAGWWRTKSGGAKKHSRPRTWHTAGKAIRLTGIERHGQELRAAGWEFLSPEGQKGVKK